MQYKYQRKSTPIELQLRIKSHQLTSCALTKRELTKLQSK